MTAVKQDEVSLIDLWRVLVQQKKVIVIVWLSTVLLALAYLLIATPMYKAEAFLLPPSQKDVQPLNVSMLAYSDSSDSSDSSDGSDGQDRAQYSIEQVYALFVQTLKSRANRRNFYNKHKIAEELGFDELDNTDDFFERMFNESLVVTQDFKKKELEAFVSVSFESSRPELSAVWVNGFINSSARIVSQQLVEGIYAKVESKKLSLESSLAGKLQLAKQRRSDRIVELKEALIMAHDINEGGKKSNSAAGIGGLAMNTEHLPLYLLGAASLEAEVKVLESRKDDAPFIKGLRDLEERIAAYDQVSVDKELINPMFFDQQAFSPREPVAPKKLLLLLLAGLVGLLFGVMVALIRNAVRGAGEAT